MRVKAVDIARKLEISKATVSLALNDKPGVSPETREAVLQCKETLEKQFDLAMNAPADKPAEPAEHSRLLKVVMVDRGQGILCDPELNIWTSVLRIFDREAIHAGYSLGITYVTPDKEDIERVVNECASPSVAGVILYATEMSEEDFGGLRAIQKPMISYDYDFGNQCFSIVIDNEAAAQKAVEFLASKGCKKITYLAQEIDIYNFERRRVGFFGGLQKEGLDLASCPIVRAGTTVASVEAFMRRWVVEHTLPDAFLMENYQISIGVMNALRARNISVPQQVSLLGIDEIPAYAAGDYPLTCVRIEHEARAQMIMTIFLQELNGASKTKFKLSSRSELVMGGSTR